MLLLAGFEVDLAWIAYYSQPGKRLYGEIGMRQQTERQVCSSCEGNEVVCCPECQGGGGIWETGGGIAACERCEGEGTIPCPACDGTGALLAGK